MVPPIALGAARENSANPTGSTLAKPMSLITWKATPHHRLALWPAGCRAARASIKGAVAEITTPMVSLVISFGSVQRVPYQRQKITAPAMVKALMKASRLTSQLGGTWNPRIMSWKLSAPQIR